MRGPSVDCAYPDTSKTDKPGINITVAPSTRGEQVYIPACVTHSAENDLVYNDFYIGEDADVTIVAGCGVHSDGEGEARHNGVHFSEKGRAGAVPGKAHRHGRRNRGAGHRSGHRGGAG